MPQELCPKCRGTDLASVGKNGVRGVVRCDWVKVSRSGRLMDEARIPGRYAENKTTILTTNYPDREELKSPRKSVNYSRLYETCKPVVMQGEDFRQKHK